MIVVAVLCFVYAFTTNNFWHAAVACALGIAAYVADKAFDRA